MKYILIVAAIFVFSVSGCAYVDATADPTTGRISSIHYRAFLRDYNAMLEETKDGVKVTVGAKSNAQTVSELLGAVVGATATLAGKGMIP